jgi:predicted ATP-dependent serine protease
METEEEKLGKQSWLIPKILSTGGLHYISSPPGSGKTWVMCDLIRACCFGGKWLDEFEIPQTKVLYLDEEMGVQKVLERLRKLGMRSAEGMGYLNRVGIRFDQPLDVERIVKHCQSQGIGLVLIDSLVRVHGLDENDNSQMRKLYDSFKKLLDVGITVLIAHHNRKGGTDSTVKHEGMRGAAEIVAAADMAYSVEKQANGLYRMFVTKGRLISDEDAIDVTFEIRDEDGLTQVRTLDAGARSEVITQEIRSKLIELISGEPGITQTRLAELCGARKSVVAATLADLEASRIVAFDKGPNNRKMYRPTGLL